MNGVNDALAILEGTPQVLRALLTDTPADLLGATDGEWTALDVVAHLASLDPFTLERRVRAIVEGSEPPLPEIDEHELLARSGYAGLPLDQLLSDFATRRASIVAWLRQLTPTDLNRFGNHQSVGRLTAAEIINHKAWHDLSHIQQICRIIAAAPDALSGPMRQFH